MKINLWKKGTIINVKKLAFFMDNGKKIIAVEPGSILVPAVEASEFALKTCGPFDDTCFTWSFVLPGGAIADFYLIAHVFSYEKQVEQKIRECLEGFFETTCN